MAEKKNLKRQACNDIATTSTEIPAKKKPRAFWMKGLYDSLENESLRVFKDDKVVVIKDLYGKAKFHYLVISLNKLNGIGQLHREHLDLIEHMEQVGREVTAKERKEGHLFRYGFHAIPSMPPLHMHVISQDFDSGALKNKKHWNSFTTDFFKDVKSVIKLLRAEGKVEFEREYHDSLLKGPLRCHRCGGELSNIPKLKAHIKTCNS